MTIQEAEKRIDVLEADIHSLMACISVLLRAVQNEVGGNEVLEDVENGLRAVIENNKEEDRVIENELLGIMLEDIEKYLEVGPL